MSDLQKPSREDELPRPFEQIGEPGWADRSRSLLKAYGVPLPEPVPAEALDAAEARSTLSFPAAYRTLLLELGPIDLDGYRFLPPDEIERLHDFWCREAFARDDAARLGGLVAIVDYCGSGDVIALEPSTGLCVLCGHDPPGFSNTIQSIDALVQLAFLMLPNSYYGWPDESLEQMVEREQKRRFGTHL